MTAGSLAQLENFLNDNDSNRRTCGSTASDNANQNIVTSTSTGSVTDHSVQCSQTAQSSHSSNGDANQKGLRRRGNRHSRTSHEDLSLSKMWILPIFHYERYGTKVKHLPVDSNTSDENLFTKVKERYLEEGSRIRRFFALRGVKKISYVKVCSSSIFTSSTMILKSFRLSLEMSDHRFESSSFMHLENPTFINLMTGRFQSTHHPGYIRAAQLRRNTFLSSVIHTSCTFGRIPATLIWTHTGHGVVGFGGYLTVFARDTRSLHRHRHQDLRNHTPAIFSSKT